MLSLKEVEDNFAFFVISIAIGIGLGVTISQLAFQPKSELQLEAQATELKEENVILLRSVGDAGTELENREAQIEALKRRSDVAEAEAARLGAELENRETQIEGSLPLAGKIIE